MISTIGSGQPEKGPDSLQIYLKAKGLADEALIKAALTIQ